MRLSKFFFSLTALLIALGSFSKSNAAHATTDTTGVNENQSHFTTDRHGCGCGCGSCAQSEIATPKENRS